MNGIWGTATKQPPKSLKKETRVARLFPEPPPRGFEKATR